MRVLSDRKQKVDFFLIILRSILIFYETKTIVEQTDVCVSINIIQLLTIWTGLQESLENTLLWLCVLMVGGCRGG